MLDLKNCPFCGGKATFAKTTKGWKVECEGRWGTCTINARTHYQPTKGQAVDAWNRRALQAVGPEPAIADNDHKDEETHAAERVARAALSGSGSGWPVPDGWKLVPVEPDDAMIEAGQDTCEEKNSWGGRVYASDIWESMLAASPAAPQQGGE